MKPWSLRAGAKLTRLLVMMRLLLISSIFLGLWPMAIRAEKEEDTWWSLRPLARPALPKIQGVDAQRVETTIDRFIVAEHEKRGLTLSSEADRRTLIRRVYYDVIGLPPSPSQVEAFVADPDPDAYSKLVESLLASPHYGERWARHWLDVVHYGESHGYDKDKPRPNAWPYRDYVIRAFNEDKPYARFVEEQLAGDVLWPNTTDGIVATGFIAAGPWDFIGHAEVPEEKIDGKVARHLDRDDMVMTTMNSFCSLTVQCAQCHDHKLDPVTMKDYYSLQSVFAALDRADRPYDRDPKLAARRAKLAGQQSEIKKQIEAANKALEALKTPELRDLEKRIAELTKKASGAAPQKGQKSPRMGYHSQVAGSQDTVKWVQVDLGKKRPIDQVILMGAVEYGHSDFGFPHRFKIEVSDDAEFRQATLVQDETKNDYPRPGALLQGFEAKGVQARYVRVTGTKLWSRHKVGQPQTKDWIFALGEMAVISAGEIAKVSGVAALDSIEAGQSWSKNNLIDGIYGAYPLAHILPPEKSPSNGYHTSFHKEAKSEKWVQIDLGESLPVDRIELYPARPTDFEDTPGFGFPLRFQLLLGDKANGEGSVVFANETAKDYPNPGEKLVTYKGTAKGRYIRLQASKLWYRPGGGGHLFAMAEMRVFSGGRLVSQGKAVTGRDSVNSGKWHLRNLVDGYTSRKRISLGAADELVRLAQSSVGDVRKQLVALQSKRTALEEALIDPVLAERRKKLQEELAAIEGELGSIPQRAVVYAGTVHKGGGTFKGRGHVGGKPREIYILHRGDVTQPGDKVNPATVPGVVPGEPSEFKLPADHQEGARRVALAKWITHPENTLTWRSIVNRVWQYHFGRGIVETPNDFGHVGGLPSHSALLDWMAVEFRDGGGSLKDLHRLILNSAVYKQKSAHRDEAVAVDDSNKYLWRQNRRRLEAEALRDTVLFVAGKLDRKMGGPSFKDFVIEQPQHSPHYQYHKANHDDPSTHRRSVYRFIIRSQPQPFMDTLDCADPSQLVDKRGETTTALQALALLNNAFMVRMAEHFADNVKDRVDPVGTAVELTLSRAPSAEERALLTSFSEKHGLAATCRLLFNFTEFSFVD